ncbi:pilus assembly protein [Brevundimonas sp.]|uniref:pilus assembly protein n=1 Tax=Brevundimonas sp. TaxID=1871086 RepID=UPI0025DD1C52|nr:pilus assembly protein [Brevundimonas sp.]
MRARSKLIKDYPGDRAAAWLNGFFRARRGNINLIFALALIPIAGAVGGGVDFARATAMRSDMQDIADAAALEGAIHADLSETERRRRIGAMVDANWAREHGASDPPSWTADFSGSGVQVTLDRALPTVILGIIGMNAIDLQVSATANGSGGRGMELAVVVDVSGSMSGDIGHLRDSITDLLQVIYGDRTEARDIWISIIPFSGRVNVINNGDDWFRPGQVPANNGFQLAGVDGVNTATDYRCKQTSYTAARPRLCAARRTGSAQWDDTPASSQPFNLFGGDPVVCPVPRAQGLTRSRARLQQVTNNLCAGHGTSTQEGMAWGWRAVSPRWRGEWGDPELPLSYAESPGKIVIIMTDGRNHPSQSGDPLTEAQADAELLRTCEGMRAEGITIFAVTYRMGGALRDLYRRCTSRPEFQYDAESGPQLRAVFSEIGATITSGDVRLTD